MWKEVLPPCSCTRMVKRTRTLERGAPSRPTTRPHTRSRTSSVGTSNSTPWVPARIGWLSRLCRVASSQVRRTYQRPSRRPPIRKRPRESVFCRLGFSPSPGAARSSAKIGGKLSSNLGAVEQSDVPLNAGGAARPEHAAGDLVRLSGEHEHDLGAGVGQLAAEVLADRGLPAAQGGDQAVVGLHGLDPSGRSSRKRRLGSCARRETRARPPRDLLPRAAPGPST